MNGVWPEAFADPDPQTIAKRFRIAQEALIGRAKPGTFFYFILCLGYLPLAIGRDTGSTATLVAASALLLLGLARRYFYVATPCLDIAPERWRRVFAVLAASTILTWDVFTAFEIWSHHLDSASVVLVAASLGLRASGTYTASPDLLVHNAFSRWSRVPIIVSTAALGTDVAIMLACLMTIHALYIEMHGRQLNEEFWRAIVATEQAEAARDHLQHEVAMRQRAEVELRLAQKLESVGRLAAGIAHEINTPLQGMMGNLHFVSEGVTELLAITRAFQAVAPAIDPTLTTELEYLSENLPDSLAMTHECLERTATIVRSVKTFAHPSADTRHPLDINAALASTLALSRAEYATIATVETQFGDLPAVDCYAGELNQALLNIVVNAAQAIESRPASRESQGVIKVETSLEGDTVRIAISDTGGGIPDAIRDRIFDPFFTTKEVGKGTGQGLAIARSVITKRHGGELTFETKVGRGTTFVIRLPLAASDDLPAAA